MKKKILILLIILFASGFILSQNFNQNIDKNCGKIILKNVNGSSSVFSDYFGKKLLVVFWSPRCIHCVNEIPILKRLKKEYGDELTIISILEIPYDNFVKNFLEEKNLPYPVFKMNYNLENCLGGVRYFPTLYFLTDKTVIKGKLESFHKYNELKKIIDSL